MRWLLKKFDSLVGTVLAAAIGLAGSQLLAFMQQYHQRLGGHLAEAERNHRRLLEIGSDRTMDRGTVERLAESAASRAEDLAAAYDAVARADAFTKPFVFLSRLDREIALATLDSFRPALPLDPVSLAYGAAGMLLAWFLYEMLKLPFGIGVRRPGPARAGRPPYARRRS